MSQFVRLVLVILRASLFAFTFECLATYVPTVDWKSCSTLESKLETVLGVPLQTCARECGVRQKCFSFNYLTRVKLCELLTNDSSKVDDKPQTRPCLHGLRSNLKTQKDYYENEDIICNQNACPMPTVANADVFGNIYTVGSRIKVECHTAYRKENGTLSITCDENGYWRNFPNCSTRCGEPVALANAEIGHGNPNEIHYRYYKCNEGFQTPFSTTYVTLTCEANGAWTSPSSTCSIEEFDAKLMTSGSTRLSTEMSISQYWRSVNFTLLTLFTHSGNGLYHFLDGGKNLTSFTFGFLRNTPARHNQTVYVVTKYPNKIAITGPLQGFRIDITVSEGTEITLPGTLIVANDTGLYPSGFRLQSNASVSVYVENGFFGSVDGSVVLPDEYLSTEYTLLSWHDHKRHKAEFAVIGTADNTSIWITLPNGTMFQRIVDFYQMYLYQAAGDISGTLINSSKAIAVFAGHACTFVIDKNCDHLYEQMPPVKLFQTKFIVSFPYPRYRYVLRIIAIENDTLVRLSNGTSGSLNRAEYLQYQFNHEAIAITASKKTMVSIYSLGRQSRRAGLPETFDGSMLIVPGVALFKPEYEMFVPESVTMCVLMVTYPSYESSTDNIRLNHGQFIENKTVEVTMTGRGTYTILYTELPKGKSIIYTIDGTPFGAYLSFFRFNSETWFSLLYNFG